MLTLMSLLTLGPHESGFPAYYVCHHIGQESIGSCPKIYNLVISARSKDTHIFLTSHVRLPYVLWSLSQQGMT